MHHTLLFSLFLAFSVPLVEVKHSEMCLLTRCITSVVAAQVGPSRHSDETKRSECELKAVSQGRKTRRQRRRSGADDEDEEWMPELEHDVHMEDVNKEECRAKGKKKRVR